MKINAIYQAIITTNVYVEDENRELFRWDVNAPAAPLVKTPYVARENLREIDDCILKGYKMCLRAAGHELRDVLK